MPVIFLETVIDAPIERVFDLSRSIDLHKLSTKETHEEAIAGKTSGLIGLNETVTWRARHFGIYQKLTVKIIEMTHPDSFTDVMLEGAFVFMKHDHKFESRGTKTSMTDQFDFRSPMGPLGRIADFLFLERYMTKFLEIRNLEIKRVAEGDEWKTLLPGNCINPRENQNLKTAEVSHKSRE